MLMILLICWGHCEGWALDDPLPFPGHADEDGEDSDDEEDERAGGPLHDEEGEEEDEGEGEGEGEGEEMDEEGFEGPNQMLDEVRKSIMY